MKKRILSIMLCFICIVSMFSVMPASAANEPGMTAFVVNNVPAANFTDVSSSDWYYNAVCYAQATGIVTGSNGKYRPNNNISFAEGITIAVRIYERYHGITPTDTAVGAGEQWFAPYVRRATAYGIIPSSSLGYTSNTTRELMVALLYNALPAKEFAAKFNYILLKDVPSSNKYYQAILAFYNAGIVSGTDKYGSFNPSNSITRAEVASILYTMLQPAKRRADPNPTYVKGFPINLNNLSCSFSDVPASAWYYQSVAAQQQLGLLNGVGNNRFAPNDTVTIAQVLTVANRMYEKYYNVSTVGQSSNWMESAKNKAISYGLISKNQFSSSALSRVATRQEVIGIMYKAIGADQYLAVNEVNALPDMNGDDAYYAEVLSMYRAGVISGSDNFGTFNTTTSITRAEFATILTRMVVPAKRVRFALYPAEKITYGYSGEYVATNGKSGYPLVAYRIGNGKNVLLLTYCIHGTESGNANCTSVHGDGIILNKLAYQMIDYMKTKYSTVSSKNWSVYIIPACNPDGLNHPNGVSTGIGRQTKYFYNVSKNANGTYTKNYLTYDYRHGIDMNRSFDYNFTANTQIGGYYYCGVTPMQCVESEYLAAFAKSIKGSGKNVAIDTHGWFSQILINNSSNRYNNVVYNAFNRQFNFNTRGQLQGSCGYFAAYCANRLGYNEGCLFEMPSSVEYNGNSHYTSVSQMQSAFDRLNCAGKYKAAILDILKQY